MMAFFGLAGCGGGGGEGLFGSAGVSNGGILGSVHGVAYLGTLPISGAFITASRQVPPAITRSTRSDVDGQFAFTDLPVGLYRIVVSAQGFVQSVSIVEVYVESGTFAQVQPIFLNSTIPLGPSNLVVNLLDESTGNPIDDAVVSAGTATTSQGAGGVYGLAVPLSLASQSPPVVALSVQAEGYDTSSVNPRTVTLYPGEVVTVTVTLQPLRSTITGQLRISSLEGFYLSSGALGTVSLFVSNVSSSFSQGVVDAATGQFRVLMPASTSRRTRTFTLTFSSPLFELAVISGIVSPQANGSSIVTGVTLVPVGVTLSGQVFTSTGSPAGAGNLATITVTELGITENIVNGQYSVAGIPVGVPLTLAIVAFNPSFGLLETGRLVVQPVMTPNGVFFAPTITTRP